MLSTYLLSNNGTTQPRTFPSRPVASRPAATHRCRSWWRSSSACAWRLRRWPESSPPGPPAWWGRRTGAPARRPWGRGAAPLPPPRHRRRPFPPRPRKRSSGRRCPTTDPRWSSTARRGRRWRRTLRTPSGAVSRVGSNWMRVGGRRGESCLVSLMSQDGSARQLHRKVTSQNK